MITVITINNIYGVQVQKLELLQQFLRDKIEYRACDSPGIFKDVIQEISEFVDDLDEKHKKTKEIVFTHQDSYSFQHGQLSFFRQGARYAALMIPYFRLNWYDATKKGGKS